MRLFALISLSTLSGLVFAHPGGHEEISAREHAVRSLAARGRHLQARNCASAFAAHLQGRKARRSRLQKKHDAPKAKPGPQKSKHTKGHKSSKTSSALSTLSISSTSSAAAPHFTSLQNTTCITAPEVVEGPYYINNELIRTNLSEDQTGVQLVLDIGILDVTTCKPLSNAFVELWNANATGVYGGYTGFLGGAPPSGNNTTTFTDSSSAAPTGSPLDGGLPPISDLARNETFLRGGYFTGEGGVVELTTIYPGFYTGRTAHVHTMIHKDWEQSANGTLISHSGTLIHIGQFFFDETWNDKVFATIPYVNNTQNRTLNIDDSILGIQNSDGNNAFLALELLGETIEDGILAYITLGVDSTVSYNISNTNYFNSSTASADFTSTTSMV